tara:strand:- start:773 stop:1087 length:315 start_codon:yes stop_codon:yes gene_type:complete
MNYDNWKLSNPIDDGQGYGMVSSCCGSSYEEEVPTCAECGSDNIGEKCAGDEGWTVCDDCGAIEQGYEYVDICNECGEECEIIEEHEYKALAEENYREMMRDDW